MIKITRYNEDFKEVWNQFNINSKNSLFMFDRSYMDYHKDRFKDHSLLFWNEEKLIAILPLSEHGDVLVSHGGLTYGGFISDSKMKQHTMNDCFSALISYCKDTGINSIRYKCIPHIYHNQPAEEDRFSLFFNNANLVTVDVSTYVKLTSSLKMSKGRKAQISRAKREGIVVVEDNSAKAFEFFIDLENKVLQERHNVKAVHTGAELKMLHDSFPNNIHLIVAKNKEEIIAGTVIYEYEHVVHTQYMAANDEARGIGALDFCINSVIDTYKNNKCWLDFGISTEHGRLYLNEGLVAQKESFGGRTGIYEIWELNI